MAQQEYIKHLFENEEKSLREIARITNLSFQTVKKYAYMDDWNDKLPEVRPDRYPVLETFIPIIDQWLAEDLKQPRKQRHTVTRIHQRLVDEHAFEGSYSSVKKYVRKKKFLMKQSTDGYLPLAQPKGHAQVDFGSFKYYDRLGASHTGYALTVTFPYSNKGYTQAFMSQNQECLLEGLKSIFEHIGGVPLNLKADNMSTAVAQVLSGGKRVLTEGFTRFMLHYRFKGVFCNPAAGNEKGNVENKVGYSRRNFFVPVPMIDDFDAFNKQLLERCEADGKRKHYKHDRLINELFVEEYEALLPLPGVPYDVFRYETFKSDKYGQVKIEGSTYGLSPELMENPIQAKIFYNRIELYYERSLLKTYKRSYIKGEDANDWKQYITTLYRKPGAVEHTRFFEQMPQLWQSHLKDLNSKERKSALLILMEIVADNNANLCDDVLEMAKSYGRTDHETVRQCYYKLSEKQELDDPLKLDTAVPDYHYQPDLSSYDTLTGGGLNG